jgi:hypothetical protein
VPEALSCSKEEVDIMGGKSMKKVGCKIQNDESNKEKGKKIN